MQLPPRSSSSYTVIPEKSFHLCQTCTLSSSCARTHKRGPRTPPSRSRKYTLAPNRAHTQKTFPLFFPSSLPRLSAPPLSALHGNTTPSRRVQICSSIQLTVQSLSVSVQITSSSPHTLAPPPPEIPHIYSR